MIFFGDGQGLVIASQSSAVLSTVKPLRQRALHPADAVRRCRSEMRSQSPAIGAVFRAVEQLQSSRARFLVALALLATLTVICVAFLTLMRRARA
jgi:hypothetical protein